MKTRINTVALAVLAAIALSTIPAAEASSLQDKMNSVFDGMTNVSQPGVFETQRRGVLSGGSVFVRTPIMDTSLVNLQLPSFKAGCGGIDIFGGSFSFINFDQFVQLLRNIAANAKGYAFNVALDVACPSCMEWINALQAKVQELNSMSANSCQLAQGIVNDVASAFSTDYENKYRISGTISGLYDDWFGASSEADGQDKRKTVDTEKPEESKKIVGNIVWDALKDAKVTSWITNSGSESDEYGILMAYSGTIVIPESEEDSNNADTGSSNSPRYYPGLIDFKDIIEGGTVKTYKCDEEEQCLNPSESSTNVTGMVAKIRRVLNGEGENAGVLKKFGMSSDNAFTANEANLMSNMPGSLGAIVRNLATASPDVASDQAVDLAYAVAMSWANDMLSEQLDALKQAVKNSDKSNKNEMLEMIDGRRDKLQKQYNDYAKEHPTVSQLMTRYGEIQKNIYKLSVTSGQEWINRSIRGAD